MDVLVQVFPPSGLGLNKWEVNIQFMKESTTSSSTLPSNHGGIRMFM